MKDVITLTFTLILPGLILGYAALFHIGIIPALSVAFPALAL